MKSWPLKKHQKGENLPRTLEATLVSDDCHVYKEW